MCLLCFESCCTRSYILTKNDRSLKYLPSDTANTTQHPLSKSFQLDLQWWRRFISAWNGISIIPDTDWTPAHDLSIYTDACVEGYGALFGNHWFACTWTVEEEQQAARDKRDSMPFKELYALTRAAATWGSQWRGKKFSFTVTVNPLWMLGAKAIHDNHPFPSTHPDTRYSLLPRMTST